MLATVLTTGAMMVRSEVEGVSGFRRGGCTCNFDSPVFGCLAMGGGARVSVCGSLVGFALGFPKSVEWCTNGSPHWMLPNLLCHGTLVLDPPLPDDRWTKLPEVGKGGGQSTAASWCMALPQFQTMESVRTLWHKAAGVGM